MNLSSRELVLGWATALVILVGITYLGIHGQMDEWRKTYRDRETLNRRVRQANRTLKKQDEVQAQLAAVMAQLPNFPEGKDVTAEMLKSLEQTAQEHGLILLKRQPSPEEGLGDLYQVSINCTWEGELDALVHFLYAIHTKGANLDIRLLTVTPVQGQKGRLKGGFTADFAYTRTAAGEPEPGLQVSPIPGGSP